MRYLLPSILSLGFCLLTIGVLKAQEPRTILKNDAEIDTAVILYSRACRGSGDTEWMAMCAAAIAQAQKELEAKRPKPPEEKKP